MNIRIVTYISTDNYEDVQELVAEITNLVNKHHYNNDASSSDNTLKSLIVVKENKEVREMGANEFFAAELNDSLFTVIPAFEDEIDDSLLEEGHKENG